MEESSKRTPKAPKVFECFLTCPMLVTEKGWDKRRDRYYCQKYKRELILPPGKKQSIFMMARPARLRQCITEMNRDDLELSE